MSPAGAGSAPPMSPDPAQWPLGTVPGTRVTLPVGSGVLDLPLLRNQMHKDHLEGFSTMSQRVQGRVTPRGSWQ